MKKLWSLLFLIPLATAACDDDAVAVAAGESELSLESSVANEADWGDEPALTSSSDIAEEFPPTLAQEGCGCGAFVDDDEDGICDLAASGECRRARTGRCPCGSSCVDGC